MVWEYKMSSCEGFWKNTHAHIVKLPWVFKISIPAFFGTFENHRQASSNIPLPSWKNVRKSRERPLPHRPWKSKSPSTEVMQLLENIRTSKSSARCGNAFRTHGLGGDECWVFPKIGTPQNGWFIMENPIKMDDLGVPLFSETPCWRTNVGCVDEQKLRQHDRNIQSWKCRETYWNQEISKRDICNNSTARDPFMTWSSLVWVFPSQQMIFSTVIIFLYTNALQIMILSWMGWLTILTFWPYHIEHLKSFPTKNSAMKPQKGGSLERG